jgi:putative phosphoesterase
VTQVLSRRRGLGTLDAVPRVVVLSDTHVRAGSVRRLPDAACAEIARADVIVHAGDVVVADLLRELEGIAPVHAVLGNNDHALVGVLPERAVLDVDGLRIGVVHDSGPSNGRPARLRRWFPDAAVVVFGHSHAPMDEEGVDGQRLFNPGSPTERRRQPSHSLGVLDIDRGHLTGHRIVLLD